tara:strand:+ start:116 stop:823 length:708 start_codon:yes stop_codon:yes gene_type:complete
MLGLGNSITANQYSGSWNPLKLGSKLVNWYKYNTGITTTTVGDSANQITQWSDQQGGNNLTPTANDNTAVMPKLESDGTVFFNGSGDTLEFDSDLSFGKFSIYIKMNFKSDSAVSNDDLFEHASSGDFIKLANPTEARIKIGTRHDFSINEIIEGTAFVIGFEREADGSLAVYKDNVAGTAADGDSLNVAISTTIDLDRLGKPVNNSYWSEIVICNDIITASERNELYNYLVNVG